MRSRHEDSPAVDVVTVTKGDDWFAARDEETGVASQGKTKAEAIANLAEALKLHARPVPQDASEETEPSDGPWF